MRLILCATALAFRAACWLWQLPRRAGWGVVGFLQHWEPCLNLSLFHYPSQFSGSWRQPLPSHFWKTNTQTKKPQRKTAPQKQKEYSSPLERQILCCWRARGSWCGCLGLPVYFRSLWVQSPPRLPTDVTVSQAFLTGWTKILEMLEEHLKALHTF